ncbi:MULTISPECIES: diaminopimelate epimerase [Pseudomonas]|uniref:diaminopimelate epimerase n=1 Tax=Pseudomonas TaxID=286 RepID=UPI0008764E57|nr:MULTISPECIES: diaminopimelate epimerase [Pseudomonas]QIA04381.1 diaminopimelate epimerase [Pseudomonas fluorescens]SCZ29934.1 diaminopimelate epimerase [Pseudomonas sp. NFIX46]SDB26503.1 diaminopimelate epimerase [Pseudomonas putida]SFQ93148.1 diaminopimelate epimerase [Pseudomonas sp. NFIX49]
MTQFYDARGNIYGVVSPQALRDAGIELPTGAEQCALSRQAWSAAAIALCCDWPDGQRPAGSKSHRSDGLLIGPFQASPPFDVLIVNTDGTLAERSGNGLTIFSRALLEQGLMPEEGATLRVHHDKPDAQSPVPTSVKPAQVAGVQGFWLDLGQPGFGPAAVGALGVEPVPFNGVAVSGVRPLAQLNPAWVHSQFVRIGNPHCVTLVQDEAALPSNAQMLEAPLAESLTAIAYAMPTGAGQPCPAGVNLQWAMRAGDQRIVARVFERGEGPTASSGTSASAVASAAWRVGWVSAGEVQVVMPGGTAPILLEARDGELTGVRLFGTAVRDENC